MSLGNFTIPVGNAHWPVRIPWLLALQPVHPEGCLRLFGIGIGDWFRPKIVMFEPASNTLAGSSFAATALVTVVAPSLPASVAHFIFLNKNACAGEPETRFPDPSLSQATTNPEIVTFLYTPVGESRGLVQVWFWSKSDTSSATLVLADGIGPSIGMRF